VVDFNQNVRKPEEDKQMRIEDCGPNKNKEPLQNIYAISFPNLNENVK
jgi:hypothetical protein